MDFLLLLECNFFFTILDHHLYEGVWIRSSDGTKIRCNFGFNGKLKCQWEEGGPKNILEVAKPSITWDMDPMIKGTYSDGSITWTNGSIWVKQGEQEFLY